jgi:hypothetical protein
MRQQGNYVLSDGGQGVKRLVPCVVAVEQSTFRLKWPTTAVKEPKGSLFARMQRFGITGAPWHLAGISASGPAPAEILVA